MGLVHNSCARGCMSGFGVCCFLLIMLALISCMDLSSAKPEVLRVTYLCVTSQDSSFKYVSLLPFFAPAWYLRCHLEKIPLFPALTM